MEPRHRTTYVVSIISAVLVAGASGALTLMRDSETRDIRDALLDGEGMSFLDADGNFDRNVYDRLDQVRTLTAQGTGTKELVIDAMEHEEEFSRRFAELGDLTLYVEDYDDPEAVGALIKKLLEYRNIADEYEAATLDFLEGKLGRKLDLDDHAPYSPDEKMAKLRALLSSMREFADVSIEVYTYLLSIQGELELDDNGDLVIESDPVRERFNALIDEQSESAEILSSEAEDFEAYSIEYIKRASP